MRHSQLPVLCCALLAVVLSPGCDGWPRHAHLPQDTADAVLPGSVLPNEVTWLDGGTVVAPTLAPGPVGELPLGVGLTWEHDLVGSGHLVGEPLPQDPDTGCGLTSDHPPEERGAYRGQTDWIGLAPGEVGTLCATVSFEDPSVGADLLVYDLSSCGVPQGPWRDPDSDAVLGLDGEDSRTAWRLPVVAGAPLGIAVTAAAPDDAEAIVTYRLAVALVPRALDGLDGECPLPPADL